MKDIHVSVIDSHEDWIRLGPDWNRLLEESSSESFFLTWEWLTSWAAFHLHGARTLSILALHRHEQLIGIAPFYSERRKIGPCPLREIRLLGGPETGSDYLDVFCRSNHEYEVANTLYEFLMGEDHPGWDHLHLQDLPAESLFLLYFLNRVEAEGKFFEIERGSYCPATDLRDPAGGWPAEISPRRRKRFEQELGYLRRDHEVNHIVHGGDEAGALEDFFSLYEEKGGWSTRHVRAVLVGLVERLEHNAPIEIDILSVGGERVAGLLHLRHRRTLMLYLMAVDKTYNRKVSLGNIIIGLSIKRAVASGYRVYDFLKGEESYKFHWANRNRTSLCLHFWKRHPVALCSALGRVLRNVGKLTLR